MKYLKEIFIGFKAFFLVTLFGLAPLLVGLAWLGVITGLAVTAFRLGYNLLRF